MIKTQLNEIFLIQCEVMQLCKTVVGAQKYLPMLPLRVRSSRFPRFKSHAHASLPCLTPPSLPETGDEHAEVTEDERRWIMAALRRIERSGLTAASVSWPGRLADDPGGPPAGRRAIDLYISTELDSLSPAPRRLHEHAPSEPALVLSRQHRPRHSVITHPPTHPRAREERGEGKAREMSFTIPPSASISPYFLSLSRAGALSLPLTVASFSLPPSLAPSLAPSGPEDATQDGGG